MLYSQKIYFSLFRIAFFLLILVSSALPGAENNNELFKKVNNYFAPEIYLPKSDSNVYEFKILSAKYGSGKQWLDVTTEVTEKIKKNSLVINVGNEIAGDPIEGVQKELRVKYMVNGRIYSTTKKEASRLLLPQSREIETKDELLSFVKKYPAEVSFYGENFTTGKSVSLLPDKQNAIAFCLLAEWHPMFLSEKNVSGWNEYISDGIVNVLKKQ